MAPYSFGYLLLISSVVFAENFWTTSDFKNPIFEIQKKAIEDAKRRYDGGDFTSFLQDINFGPKSEPLLTIAVECIYTDINGTQVTCESQNFTDLELDTCDVNVDYTYSIINSSNQTATLDYILDESLSEIAINSDGSSSLLENNTVNTFQVTGVIDICQGDDSITKKVLAIASPVDPSSDKLPYAEDFLTIQPPDLPIELGFDSVMCVVNDENSTDCMTYYRTITASEPCVVDLHLNYTFTNTGLPCVNVAGIKSYVGPLGESLLNFNDIYNYQERELCSGENWTVPETKFAINVCDIFDASWDVMLDIDFFDGRSGNITSMLEWQIAPSAYPSMSSSPSSSPSIHPSMLPSLDPTLSPSSAPSIDACNDCTLTGLISATSRIKLWGSGKENLAFQGVCDVIAIDNPLLQVQIRTRPGRNGLWVGVVQVGLLLKEFNAVLFLFEGNRMVIDQTSRFANEVQYTREDNPKFLGKFIHTFQFKAAPSDNFIRIEELPYGMKSIEVLGFGLTFGRSNGLVGAWDLWDKDKRFRSRDGRVYGGFDATRVAQDWRVQENESFLFNPTDICVSESTCGDGLEVQCVEDLYSFDKSARNTCDADCEEIADPLMRLFCFLDSVVTGFNFWACQNSATNTIINESIPPACPGGCRADATNKKFFIEEIGKNKDCLWAIEEPKRTKFRCNLPEVALNCCQSCCSACVADAAGTESFDVPELGIQATCEWAASEDPTLRCSYESVLKFCCDTCASAVPSDNPSTLPSTIPSFLPTHSPTLVSDAPSSIPSIFSSMPSQHPTDFPTATPTSPPSETPTYTFSASPSSKPSKIPSDFPSLDPTDPPTPSPTEKPTKNPTKFPTSEPSEIPSTTPSESPSAPPSFFPSSNPTEAPSSIPSSNPSILPTLEPSSNPTFIPSVDPSKGPTRVPEDNPSPSAYPSENPSTSPSSSTQPSIEPSLLPSSAPSTLPPTQDPSANPSVVPSTAPSLSSVPTQSATCDSTSFLDSSIKFVYLNLCWKADFFDNGVLAADFTDNDCSNSEFTKTAVFSAYDDVHIENDVGNTNFTDAVGTLGWKGWFVFREDSSIITGNVDAIVGPSSVWNVDELTFVINLQVQNCVSYP